MWLIIFFPGIAFGFCSKSLSIDISDGVLENNTVINKHNIRFRVDNYYEENGLTFGCICEIKTCVRKCCGENEAKLETGCSPFTNQVIDYKFYNNRDLIESFDTHNIFRFYNAACQNASSIKVMLEGIFYLQTNGSVYGIDMASEDPQKYRMYSPEEICLENVLNLENNQEDTASQKVFLCVEETVEEVQVDERISVGNSFLFFLPVLSNLVFMFVHSFWIKILCQFISLFLEIVSSFFY